MGQRIEELVQHRDAFVAFARSRIADPELAADVVQDSFAKAVKAAGQLREDENVVAWYYRILRRTIIDSYRRKDARGRMLERAEVELPAQLAPEDARALCGCVLKLLPLLKPQYAEALRLADLEQMDGETAAAKLGVTPGNFKVRLHRARQQLRDRVLDTCSLCAKHGCANCECNEAEATGSLGN